MCERLWYVMCDKVYDESVRYPRVSAVKHSTRREEESEKLEEICTSAVP